MTAGGSCTEYEKREALERAISSQTFARSEQLRSFLRFVCEAELSGSTSRLSEYLIGVEVLRRPPDYSPSEDSSVRTRAYELRQKLDKLYSSEYPDEPIRIAVPKGSYTPLFVRRPLQADAPVAHGTLQIGPARAVAERTAFRRPPIFWFFALAAIFGTFFALALSFRNRTGALDPVLAEAWKPFAKRGASVLLVPATPLYLVLGPESHGAYGMPKYPAPAEAYPLFRQHRPLAPNERLGMVFTEDASGVGNLNAAVITSNVLGRLGAAAQILPERSGIMSVMHGRSVILFGAPVDSQAISEFLEKTPLTVSYDESVKEFVVQDRITGQTFTPDKESSGDFRSVYGLVTVLNTREADGEHLGTLVFSGITSVGTHGAAEYFSSPRALAALRQSFERRGIHGFPPAYQVVVKCRFEKMLLVSAEYQSDRVIRRD